MGLIEIYYLYRVDGTEDNTKEVYSLTGVHFSDEKKIMTGRELKHFKGVHDLKYEQELGLQADLFEFL